MRMILAPFEKMQKTFNLRLRKRGQALPRFHLTPPFAEPCVFAGDRLHGLSNVIATLER
jgi:hypothetical protein